MDVYTVFGRSCQYDCCVDQYIYQSYMEWENIDKNSVTNVDGLHKLLLPNLYVLINWVIHLIHVYNTNKNRHIRPATSHLAFYSIMYILDLV